MKELKFKLDNFSNNFYLDDYEPITGIYLCGDGVRDLFILPKEQTEVVFVFSRTKVEGAYQITFECGKEVHDGYKSCGILDDQDFAPAFDGFRTPMYSNAKDLLGIVWQEGYNYVRVEYDA